MAAVLATTASRSCRASATSDLSPAIGASTGDLQLRRKVHPGGCTRLRRQRRRFRLEQSAQRRRRDGRTGASPCCADLAWELTTETRRHSVGLGTLVHSIPTPHPTESQCLRASVVRWLASGEFQQAEGRGPALAPMKQGPPRKADPDLSDDFPVRFGRLDHLHVLQGLLQVC